MLENNCWQCFVALKPMSLFELSRQPTHHHFALQEICSQVTGGDGGQRRRRQVFRAEESLRENQAKVSVVVIFGSTITVVGIALTCTRWVQSTIKLFSMSTLSNSASFINLSNIKFWEHQESNPGWMAGWEA